MAARDRNDIKERQIRYVTMCLTGMPAELKTDRERAIACGYSPKSADDVNQYEGVKELFAEIAAEMKRKAIKKIVDGVGDLVATRKEAMARLWEIANMPKEEAGNTMHCQTQACIKYIELVSGEEQTAGRTRGALPRAAWMEKTAEDGPAN